LVFPNPNDEYQPIIKTVPMGTGKKIVEEMRKKVLEQTKVFQYFYIFIITYISIYSNVLLLCRKLYNGRCNIYWIHDFNG